MDIQTLKQNLSDYAVNISVIRALSAVNIEGMHEPDQYELNLMEDYSEIGRLGKTCRKILSETVYPLIRSRDHLSVEEIDALMDFCDLLIDPATGDELDLFLLYEVSERLLYELKALGDDDKYARQLNMHVTVCYGNVTKTSRITVSREICTFYRDRGLEAAQVGLTILHDKERYMRLKNEGRIYILRIARFYSALYDTFYYEFETNEIRYKALIDGFMLSEDPFYHDSVIGYNWTLHRVRCLEHMGQLTECGDKWGFTPDQCREICSWLDKLKELWEADEKTMSEIIPKAHLDLILLRNSYYAEKIDKSTYQEQLLKMYEKYSNGNFDMYSTQMNLLIPLEYLATITDRQVSQKDENTLRYLYDRVLDYVMKAVNLESFNFLQGYLIDFLYYFREVSGVMRFRDMGINCIAALHPPTYVHSLQVADISCCLLEHLYRISPDTVFAEIGERQNGPYRSIEHMLSEIYKSAMCHDFGKITMIDSIFIYGRDLLDSEFDIIHHHTIMGAKMLEKFNSTHEYAVAALKHHTWYDGKGGYPEGDGRRPSLFPCIISVADSIDAASDNIGRSYRKGKGVDEIISEIKKESGTRYAPYIANILNDEKVMADIKYILTDGRRNKYRKTYLLLCGLADRTSE